MIVKEINHYTETIFANADHSATLLNLLFKYNTQPAWVYDVETLLFVAVNDAALKLYGFSREEFFKMSVNEICLNDKLNKTDQIENGSHIYKLKKKDGLITNVETVSHTFSSEGQKLRLVIVNKVNEQTNQDLLLDEHDLLRVLMDSIPDTIYFKDTSSRFIKVNKAQADTLGASSAEEVVGKSDFDFFMADHARAAYEDEQELINTRKPVINKLERIRKGDGHFIWVTATKVPMINKRGEVVGIAGISRDVTENKLIEEKLRLFATKLEQSNRELQDFASVASHDLQEPLRKIQAFGDRLKTKCAASLSDEGRDYLERMQNAAGRMQVLINDLLTFSRVATKAKPFEPIDLTEVLNGVLSDLEIRIEQNHGRVEACALPTIDADALQLRQLFQNLIGNALKFHKEGVPPVVKITCSVSNESNDEQNTLEEGFCEIRIEDNGIGFEEKYLDRIFNVFQRLHGRGVYEGTGIGLAVCRKIVERHGGQITAESTPGEGSAFIFTLPIKQAHEELTHSE